MTRGRPSPLELSAIVEAGLCIGCGLCRSVAGGDRVRIVMTPEGRERPVAREPLDEATLRRINEVCPGTEIGGADDARLAPGTSIDPVWGPTAEVLLGHAADPEVRYRGASGGVLTALGRYLLERGDVEVVLHVAASVEQPMRSRRKLSFDAAQVLDGAGSRYGPVAPLLDLGDLLEAGRPFAFIGKPCDVTALRSLARHDHRVDELLRFALAMVCGGASELAKSTEVLERHGVGEEELGLFRYRGHGNPGPTRVETRDGRSFELTYGEMWAEEASWRLQSRCTICPDAIGESADVVAMDCWPDGDPAGEDEGFNAIVARTARGATLLADAIGDGALVSDGSLDVRDLDGFQPHQVARKRAVWARLAGRRAAGVPVPHVHGLRIRALAEGNSMARNLAEARGTRERVRSGRAVEVAVREPASGPASPASIDRRERPGDNGSVVHTGSDQIGPGRP